MVLYVDICLLEFTLIFSDAIFGWIRLSRIHVKTLNPVETFFNQVTHINLYFSNLKFGMRCLTCWRHFPLDTNIPRSWTATTVSTAICVVSVSIVNNPTSGLCTVLTFTRVSVNDFFFHHQKRLNISEFPHQFNVLPKAEKILFWSIICLSMNIVNLVIKRIISLGGNKSHFGESFREEIKIDDKLSICPNFDILHNFIQNFSL